MMSYYAAHVNSTQERAIQLEEMTMCQGAADDLSTNVASRKEKEDHIVCGRPDFKEKSINQGV